MKSTHTIAYLDGGEPIVADVTFIDSDEIESFDDAHEGAEAIFEDPETGDRFTYRSGGDGFWYADPNPAPITIRPIEEDQ